MSTHSHEPPDLPLTPPRPHFIIDESRDDQYTSSEPPTPRAISPRPSIDSTATTRNPFATQYQSKFATGDNTIQTPTTTPGMHTPAGSLSHFPFPDFSNRVSSITSMHDLPRVASFYSNVSSSRPNTARSSRQRETFTSPPTRPLTANSAHNAKMPRNRMRSTMLAEGEQLSKPWLEETRDPYVRISYFTTYGVMFLGVIASVVVSFFGYRDVPLITNKLCMVMDEKWQGGEDALFGPNGRWLREVQLDGFGNGEFEMTTASSNNSFIQDGKLHIMPTLTSDVIGNDNVFNGYTLNLTDCTYNITRDAYPTEDSTKFGSSGKTANGSSFDQHAYLRACSAVSNSTSGSIINPVQSARLSTRRSASIRYGKVEVRAKLPRGDWLWPAIWMLPVVNTYGPWPISGEIDIMEARGNGLAYPKQGNNVVRGSLNWGPLTWINKVSLTYGWWSMRRASYSSDFHTYTLEWTDKFLRIYVDTRLHHMMDLRFNMPFFQRGEFPPVVQNGSDYIALKNPWVNGTMAAPFDQKFYLILNVAVGGTNGWFPDGAGDKPWLDGSQNAMRDFAMSKDKWFSTWPKNSDRAMIVESVKMWEIC